MLANTENTTILLPVANVPMFANQAIYHLINNSPCKVIVLYDKGTPDQFVQNDKVTYVKNDHATGLCSLWNKCIEVCPTEYIILMAWRCRPTQNDFDIIFSKLNEGFGCVATQTLHFFGFSKHLLTKIGFFDTGFTTGQWEDGDFYNRLCFENIALYISNETPEVVYNSTWLLNPEPNIKYYKSKWLESSPNLTMLKLEENYDDRLKYKGLYEEKNYKTFDQSVLMDECVKKYFKENFTNYTRAY
jgi:hypothetical protein